MNWPREVLTLLNELEQAGFEAWAVGGCVRDRLLGRTPADWDLCTNARPEDLRRIFAGRPLVLTGVKHGTVGVAAGGGVYEITTYRTEKDYRDRRHPSQVHFVDRLEEDLARRDFTVNAMACHPRRGLRDPFGGRGDLRGQQIRCVGDAKTRFSEDALRILRGLRLAAQLDFSIEDETLAAMTACRSLLTRISAERLYGELTRLLCGPAAGRVLAGCGDILVPVIPELAPCIGLEQHSIHHDRDVYGHMAAAVAFAPADPNVRWAAFRHDVGKPGCLSLDAEGAGHFYGHNERGAQLVQKILTRLHAPKSRIARVSQLVRMHDMALPATPQGVRRWLRRLDETGLMQLAALRRADLTAHACTPWVKQRLAQLDAFVETARAQLAAGACYRLDMLAVNGRDVIEAGAVPGPEVGRVLNALLDSVIDGEVPNERDALLQRAAYLAHLL